MSLCFYVSLSLSLPSISPKPNLTLNMTVCWSAHPPLSLSHTPPLLFPYKKFPVEAHFWLDELLYYIDCLRYMISSFILFPVFLFLKTNVIPIKCLFEVNLAWAFRFQFCDLLLVRCSTSEQGQYFFCFAFYCCLFVSLCLLYACLSFICVSVFVICVFVVYLCFCVCYMRDCCLFVFLCLLLVCKSLSLFAIVFFCMCVCVGAFCW
jgi:hypothetical protein